MAWRKWSIASNLANQYSYSNTRGGLCREQGHPLNVSDEVTDLKDLASEQLFDESGESDYLQPELDEGKRDFQF